ncbi:MAG: bifunctional folylpolyglutamate synthase/dihydrofolate synthase [Clostridia bacterium]|nr:bifunctional folylpolyglutamate synthase/dihydrofolate synthase [Clostridia bacterium]
MTYQEALDYIHGISWTFCKPGLERTEELCRRLGNPERSLNFVHVAGTNGKGSFSSMLASVLERAGLKVGLYTSPYIVRFNERMKINGEDIPDAELAEITEYVRPHAEAMADRPTEFELITAIAFEFFKRRGVDIVVLEAGMGGRLDSTNVIPAPVLSVITGIALDHTAFLGDTVEKIAAEKAGIIKRGAPVLFGGEDESAERVIRARAEELSSPFYKTRHSSINIKKATLDGTLFDYSHFSDVKIKLLGTYQPRNAANVLEAVDILRRAGYIIPDGAVSEGLAAARWPARFEIISHAPLTIYDGAHNAEGIESAVKSIRALLGGGVYAVTGVLADKDYGAIAKELSTVTSRAYTITPDNPRALPAEKYAEVLRSYGVEALPYGSIDGAVRAAKRDAKRDGKALVCLGSLYIYSEIKQAIEGD